MFRAIIGMCVLVGCQQPARPLVRQPPAPAHDEVVIADPGPALEMVATPPDAAVPDAPTDLLTATATPRHTPATGERGGWHWDSPAPQGNDLEAIWDDGSTIYAVGSAGTILRSSDRGRSWQLTYVDRDLDLVAVWSIGADDIYIGGKRGAASLQGVLLHSRDRGATWDRRDTTEHVTGFWGPSPDDVYLVGTAGLIERSTDRGATWQTQPAVTSNNLKGIAGDDAAMLAVGWGTRGELLRRTRNDARWSAPVRPADENWHSVCLDGRGGAFAAGLIGTARSTDRGRTWTVHPTKDQALYSIWCGAPGEAVAVGARGATVRTGDGGKTWTTVETGDNDLNAIASAPNGPLLAVGKSGTILASHDRGRTWKPMSDSAPYLLSIWQSSPHDIYAVGWVGAVLHGTGDEHWSTLALGTTSQLVSVWGSGPDDIYIAGWYGEIFHSTDRGLTWTHAKVEGTLSKVWGTSRDDVYLIGASGRMYHSADRGRSWQTIATGTDHHLEAMWGDGNAEIDVVGDYGAILQSRDHGKHWRYRRLWTPKDGVSAKGLISVIGNAAGERFAIGYCDGCLVYSRDRGETWEIRETHAAGAPRSLFLDGDRVMAFGDYGTILELDAQRTAWTVTTTPSDIGLGATSGDEHDRYAIGYAGTILHRIR